VCCCSSSPFYESIEKAYKPCRTDYWIRRLRLSRLLLEQEACHPSPQIIRTFGTQSPFAPPMFNNIFYATIALWVAFELLLLAFRRSDDSTQRQDMGTLRWLNIIIYTSVTAAVISSSRGFGQIHTSLFVHWLGLLLLVAGLGFRIWAIRVLRQFFTVDVAIHSGQRLVENGPYRHIRHPAYSGSLFAFAGLAICMSSWISALVLLIPITSAFLRRISIEERALTAAFPVGYPEYAKRTFRLFPGIY